MSNSQQPVWPIYKRLLGYTDRYRFFLIAAVVGMAVEAAAGYGFIRLMDPLVNRGFVNPEPKMAVLLPLAIIGLFVVRSLATFVSDYGMARTGRSVVRDLREEVLSKYLRLPSTHFDAESTPVMVSRLNFDTEQVAQASSDALKTLVADGLTIIAMVVLMLQMSVKVTLALVVIAPLIGVAVLPENSAASSSAPPRSTAFRLRRTQSAAPPPAGRRMAVTRPSMRWRLMRSAPLPSPSRRTAR